MGRAKPQPPIVPPEPGTNKAAELLAAEHDLLDAFLCIQEAMHMGLCRACVMAAGGIVNVITNQDHPPKPEEILCAGCIPMAEADRPKDCAVCALLPKHQPRPVIRRYLGVNIYESFLSAGLACYGQIQHQAEKAEDPTMKAAAEAHIARIVHLREMRTKRIITDLG